jgi:hypothetical protein
MTSHNHKFSLQKVYGKIAKKNTIPVTETIECIHLMPSNQFQPQKFNDRGKSSQKM